MFPDKPVVMVEDVFVKPGDMVHLMCNCSGYPQSQITWRYKPCSLTPTWPTCDESSIKTFSDDGVSIGKNLIVFLNNLLNILIIYELI